MYLSDRPTPQNHYSLIQLKHTSCSCYISCVSGRWNMFIGVTQGPRLTKEQLWHVPLFCKWYGKRNMANYAVVFKLLPGGDTSHFCSYLIDQNQSDGHAHNQGGGVKSPSVPEKKGKPWYLWTDKPWCWTQLDFLCVIIIRLHCLHAPPLAFPESVLMFLMLFNSCMEEAIIFFLMGTKFWNWFILVRYGPCAYPWVFERTKISRKYPTWIIWNETVWEGQFIKVKSRQQMLGEAETILQILLSFLIR